jgi:hypothetical protein
VNGASYGLAGGNPGQTQYARGPVYASDLFNPITGTWSTLASASNKRLYHSGALLLPSGHVITSGSEMSNYDDFYPTPKANCFENITNKDTSPKPGPGCTDPFNYNLERFSPPYLFASSRPDFQEAPVSTTHGSLIKLTLVSTSGIARVTMLRIASTTHSTNTDQRLIELVISAFTGSALYVNVPSNPALATPGNWMVFVMDQNNIPSIAKTVRIAVGDPVKETIPGGASTGPPAKTNGERSSSFSTLSSLLVLCLAFFH